MPAYKFLCKACGLEETRRVAEGVKSVACRSCAKPVTRAPPAGFSAGVEVKVTGIAPQDTGARKVDAVFDETVRADAEAKWGTIAARQRAKIEVMVREGVTGHDIRRAPDGTYEPMAPEERRAAETARKTFAGVQKAAQDPKP